MALKAGAVGGHCGTVRAAEQQVEEFFGHPVCHPREGPLLLASPQAAELWEGVRDAAEMPKM